MKVQNIGNFSVISRKEGLGGTSAPIKTAPLSYAKTLHKDTLSFGALSEETATIVKYAGEPSGKNVLNMLSEAKQKFDFGETLSILGKAAGDPAKQAILQTLINAKNDEGGQRFSHTVYIKDMLGKIDTEEKRQLFDALMEAKDDEGKQRYGDNEIFFIIGSYKDQDTQTLFKTLSAAKDDEGKQRFNGDAIGRLTQHGSFGLEFIHMLMDAKDDEGKQKFSGKNIKSIAMNCGSRDTRSLIKPMIDAKDDKGKPLLSGDDITSIAIEVESGFDLGSYNPKYNRVKELLEQGATDASSIFAAVNINL